MYPTHTAYRLHGQALDPPLALQTRNREAAATSYKQRTERKNTARTSLLRKQANMIAELRSDVTTANACMGIMQDTVTRVKKRALSLEKQCTAAERLLCEKEDEFDGQSLALKAQAKTHSREKKLLLKEHQTLVATERSERKAIAARVDALQRLRSPAQRTPGIA